MNRYLVGGIDDGVDLEVPGVAAPEVDPGVDLLVDGEPRGAPAAPAAGVVAGERVGEGEEAERRGLLGRAALRLGGLAGGGGGGEDALVRVAPARHLVQRHGRLDAAHAGHHVACRGGRRRARQHGGRRRGRTRSVAGRAAAGARRGQAVKPAVRDARCER